MYKVSMSNSRIWIYSVVLFVASAIILATQVSWLIQAADIEERFLNQRVNHALCMALEELSTDKAMCSSIQSCVARSRDSFDLRISRQDHKKIDSVIRKHLIQNQIAAPFSTTLQPVSISQNQAGIQLNQAFLYPVNQLQPQNVLIQLDIPSKNDLIWKQINSTFVLSVVMLLILAVIFVGALRSLLKERSIRLETVDILNTMAHDLKTPISNLSLAVTMLKKNQKNTSQPDYLDVIDAEIANLRARSRQILGVGSVDGLIGNHVRIVPTDLHEIIRDCVDQFAIQLREKNGRIDLELNAQLPVIQGDREQLKSVFLNILDNAVTYASPSPMIVIRSSSRNESIRIEISDNGPGIPANEQELIFSRGYRLQNSRHEGSGLGLYLAKTVTERYCGMLSVQSDGKSGSTFILDFKTAR